MTKRIFIAGTDTDSGKTYVTTQLLYFFAQQQQQTIALKPVASGWQDAKTPMNDDALQLQQAASVSLSYQEVNPVLLPEPIAPHIAAAHQQQRLAVANITAQCEATLAKTAADYALIEGCGGWLCPLNEHETMADLALALKTEIILVVGMKLGCLNHTLLTVQAMLQSKAKLIGWIANRVAPNMLALEENITSLQQRIRAPLLARVDYGGCLQVSECLYDLMPMVIS